MLFGSALGLEIPWQVVSIDFDPDAKRLDLYLDFPRGSRFLCPDCNASCPVHDTVDRVWRHLSFFEHKTYLHARTPRVNCAHCGVKTVHIKWAQPGSGFTLLFEAMALLMVKQMPFVAAARLMQTNDDALWRISRRYVYQARDRQDMSAVKEIGVDETQCAAGHNYVTVVADVDDSKVLHVTEGRDIKSLESFKDDFEQHGGKIGKVKSVCMDMSVSFISAIAKLMPSAKMIFDRFHVMKLANQAVDAVRRDEVKTNAALKDTRYLWLRNPQNLSDAKREKLDNIVSTMNTQTALAYQMKLNLQEMWTLKTRKEADAHLKSWIKWIAEATIHDSMKKLANTILSHADGILNYFPGQLTSGFMEGINSRIQAARAKARGYRNTDNFITVVYLIAGKLDFNLPI
jgi:transposase